MGQTNSKEDKKLWDDYETIVSSVKRAYSTPPIRELKIGNELATRLEELELAGNQVELNDLDTMMLLRCERLRSLNLSSNPLSSAHVHTLLSGSFAHTALTSLSLQQCNLETVPDSLTHMSALEFLDLSRNQLDSMPACPTSLQTLILADNRLESLPSLTKLTKLRSFFLQSNTLKTLPRSISNAADNCLESVPASLATLANLRNVDLRRNSTLMHIPQELIRRKQESARIVCESWPHDSMVPPIDFALQVSLPDEIGVDSRLFIGCMDSAANLDALRARRITHVLCAADGLPLHFTDDFVYLHIKALDIFSYDIASHFEESNAFIQEALRKKNAHVLVHCRMGASRSATLVLAYLIAHCDMSFKDALNHVRLYRYQVHPNAGFCAQLQDFAHKRSHHT